MNKKKVAIVVPHHRINLKWNEEISIKRCKEVFSQYNIILVCPEGIEKEEFEKYKIFNEYITFEDKEFESEDAYNNLLLKSKFYKKFLEYEYILIYQLDTFVFKDELLDWCVKGYDYVGAPWDKESEWLKKYKKSYPKLSKYMGNVGNGGLSLRKVNKFYWISKLLFPLTHFWKGEWHEDIFWSWVVKAIIYKFKIPDENIAIKFAFEQEPEKLYIQNNKQLPFGCHAWEKFGTEFWQIHLKEYGYEIIEQIKGRK